MHLNYLILCHKNLAQVDNLIDTIQHPNARIFVHIDQKVCTNEIKQQKFITSKNVTVLKKRLVVSWGGFSMVESTLLLLTAALQQHTSGYMILLSGEDYPLKPSAEIYSYLNKNYGTQYLEFKSIPDTSWNLNGGEDRFRYYWFVDEIGYHDSHILYKLQYQNNLQRQIIPNFDFFGGSQWWCITTECVYYIVEFLKKNPDYLKFFKYSHIPDELFFHCIIMNSFMSEQVVNNNLRYIDWNTSSGHPKILTLDDLNSMKQSNKFWARKIQLPTSENLLKALDEKFKLKICNYPD